MTAFGVFQRKSHIIATIVAVIALVTVQIFAAIHGQEFGDEPHSHNGVQCLFVGCVSDGGDAGLAAAFIVLAIAFVFAISLTLARQTVRPVLAKRHAPRAPPAL